MDGSTPARDFDYATEGYADADNDGVPNYLDGLDQANILPSAPESVDGYFAESDAGIRITLGRFARQGENNGVQLSDEDLEVIEDLYSDPDYVNVGGVFDFEAHDLPNAGQTVRFVFPQKAAVSATAIYRKFTDAYGWTAFAEDNYNKLSSTLGAPGFCSPPGDDSWSPGLTEGHWCVQIEIQDGGANDEDGQANGVIVDPGGVSTLLSTTVTTSDDDNEVGDEASDVIEETNVQETQTSTTTTSNNSVIVEEDAVDGVIEGLDGESASPANTAIENGGGSVSYMVLLLGLLTSVRYKSVLIMRKRIEF